MVRDMGRRIPTATGVGIIAGDAAAMPAHIRIIKADAVGNGVNTPLEVNFFSSSSNHDQDNL
jgi:hypothetical protein